MAKVKDSAGNEVEQYRFTFGHLYEFDADKNAYVHCYFRIGANKRASIQEYESEGTE